MSHKLPLLLFIYFFCTGLVNLSGQVKFTLDDETVDPGTSFCKDFVVEDFTDIVTLQFSLNWDPNVIRLDSITNLNIPEPQSFTANLALAASGRMPVIWFDPMGGGLSVNDGVSVFSLCFTAIGTSQQCTNLEFTNIPLNIDVTDANSNGQNIGLIAPVTTLCIANQLSVFRTNITTGDCNNPDGNGITVVLQGGTFPYTYSWSGPNGFISSSPILTMLEDGDYRLTITDSSAPPFVLTDTFPVYGDFAAPDITIAPSENIDCDTDELTLDAEASSMGSMFAYQWNTSSGNIVSGGTSLSPVVNAAGWYQLVITNGDNGCMAEERIEVKVDTVAPIAQAVAQGLLTCTDSIISLSAGGSSTGANINYLWTTTNGNILSGADSLNPKVNVGGNYLLLVSNSDNGCQATTGVVVEENKLLPLAEAGGAEVDCDSLRVFLNVNNAGATGLNYEWGTMNGFFVKGEQTERPQIGQGGTYELSVTDPANGCENLSTILVDNALFPLPAVAGENQASCVTDAVIAAGLPANAFGEWTSESGAIISDALSDTTAVSNLREGQNLFIWMLSTNECPDYDADTLSIWLEGSPLANDDSLSLPFGAPSVTFNVALNDSTQRLGGWDITIIDQPDQGMLVNRGFGLFDISYPLGSQGNTSFRYQICNSICPTFCDEATVLLSFQANPSIDTSVHIANGITPNGDGINEFLIIPELEEMPSAFPNNELIIFNRWGDVVYRAQPYLNDWDGRTNEGKPLPQGTYYYLMTMEFGSSQVFKGDITILK